MGFIVTGARNIGLDEDVTDFSSLTQSSTFNVTGRKFSLANNPGGNFNRADIIYDEDLYNGASTISLSNDRGSTTPGINFIGTQIYVRCGDSAASLTDKIDEWVTAVSENADLPFLIGKLSDTAISIYPRSPTFSMTFNSFGNNQFVASDDGDETVSLTNTLDEGALIIDKNMVGNTLQERIFFHCVLNTGSFNVDYDVPANVNCLVVFYYEDNYPELIFAGNFHVNPYSEVKSGVTEYLQNAKIESWRTVDAANGPYGTQYTFLRNEGGSFQTGSLQFGSCVVLEGGAHKLEGGTISSFDRSQLNAGAGPAQLFCRDTTEFVNETFRTLANFFEIPLKLDGVIISSPGAILNMGVSRNGVSSVFGYDNLATLNASLIVAGSSRVEANNSPVIPSFLFYFIPSAVIFYHQNTIVKTTKSDGAVIEGARIIFTEDDSGQKPKSARYSNKSYSDVTTNENLDNALITWQVIQDHSTEYESGLNEVKTHQHLTGSTGETNTVKVRYLQGWENHPKLEDNYLSALANNVYSDGLYIGNKVKFNVKKYGYNVGETVQDLLASGTRNISLALAIDTALTDSLGAYIIDETGVAATTFINNLKIAYARMVYEEQQNSSFSILAGNENYIFTVSGRTLILLTGYGLTLRSGSNATPITVDNATKTFTMYGVIAISSYADTVNYDTIIVDKNFTNLSGADVEAYVQFTDSNDEVHQNFRLVTSLSDYVFDNNLEYSIYIQGYTTDWENIHELKDLTSTHNKFYDINTTNYSKYRLKLFGPEVRESEQIEFTELLSLVELDVLGENENDNTSEWKRQITDGERYVVVTYDENDSTLDTISIEGTLQSEDIEGNHFVYMVHDAVTTFLHDNPTSTIREDDYIELNAKELKVFVKIVKLNGLKILEINNEYSLLSLSDLNEVEFRAHDFGILTETESLFKARFNDLLVGYVIAFLIKGGNTLELKHTITTETFYDIILTKTVEYEAMIKNEGQDSLVQVVNVNNRSIEAVFTAIPGIDRPIANTGVASAMVRHGEDIDLLVDLAAVGDAPAAARNKLAATALIYDTEYPFLLEINFVKGQNTGGQLVLGKDIEGKYDEVSTDEYVLINDGSDDVAATVEIVSGKQVILSPNFDALVSPGSYSAGDDIRIENANNTRNQDLTFVSQVYGTIAYLGIDIEVTSISNALNVAVGLPFNFNNIVGQFIKKSGTATGLLKVKAISNIGGSNESATLTISFANGTTLNSTQLHNNFSSGQTFQLESQQGIIFTFEEDVHGDTIGLELKHGSNVFNISPKYIGTQIVNESGVILGGKSLVVPALLDTTIVDGGFTAEDSERLAKVDETTTELFDDNHEGRVGLKIQGSHPQVAIRAIAAVNSDYLDNPSIDIFINGVPEQEVLAFLYIMFSNAGSSNIYTPLYIINNKDFKINVETTTFFELRDKFLGMFSNNTGSPSTNPPFDLPFGSVDILDIYINSRVRKFTKIYEDLSSSTNPVFSIDFEALPTESAEDFPEFLLVAINGVEYNLTRSAIGIAQDELSSTGSSLRYSINKTQGFANTFTIGIQSELEILSDDFKPVIIVAKNGNDASDIPITSDANKIYGELQTGAQVDRMEKDLALVKDKTNTIITQTTPSV